MMWLACSHCYWRFPLEVSQSGCRWYLNFVRPAELYLDVNGSRFINISLLLLLLCLSPDLFQLSGWAGWCNSSHQWITHSRQTLSDRSNQPIRTRRRDTPFDLIFDNPTTPNRSLSVIDGRIIWLDRTFAKKKVRHVLKWWSAIFHRFLFCFGFWFHCSLVGCLMCVFFSPGRSCAAIFLSRAFQQVLLLLFFSSPSFRCIGCANQLVRRQLF